MTEHPRSFFGGVFVYLRKPRNEDLKMKKTITLGNKAVECVCNALTPILYTQVFNKDFLVEMMSIMSVKAFDKVRDEIARGDIASIEAKKESIAKSLSPEDVANILSRSKMNSEVLFVMSKQAETEDVDKLSRLSKRDFLIWLSGFENGAFNDPNLTNVVLEIWNGNTSQTTEPKNA